MNTQTNAPKFSSIVELQKSLSALCNYLANNDHFVEPLDGLAESVAVVVFQDGDIGFIVVEYVASSFDFGDARLYRSYDLKLANYSIDELQGDNDLGFSFDEVYKLQFPTKTHGLLPSIANANRGTVEIGTINVLALINEFNKMSAGYAAHLEVLVDDSELNNILSGSRIIMYELI